MENRAISLDFHQMYLNLSQPTSQIHLYRALTTQKITFFSPLPPPQSQPSIGSSTAAHHRGPVRHQHRRQKSDEAVLLLLPPLRSW
ncbi:hypothetical protein SDJN03_17372, partial [Cucurbita argyrosperma subsp. sororia]